MNGLGAWTWSTVANRLVLERFHDSGTSAAFDLRIRDEVTRIEVQAGRFDEHLIAAGADAVVGRGSVFRRATIQRIAATGRRVVGGNLVQVFGDFDRFVRVAVSAAMATLKKRSR